MSIIERRIETARGPMAWIEAGTGWPVILLHAFPFHAGMWRPQLARVPAGWRFIAPHLRGFGQTPGRASSMDDYAADVWALLDALHIDDAPIGGLSMGGYVTFAMFRQAPSRFTGMILADTRAQADTPQAREGRMQMRKTLAAQGPSGVAAAMLPKLFSTGASLTVVEGARTIIESASVGAIDDAIGAMMDRPDSTPVLVEISCAAVVMVGEHDAIAPPDDAQAMQAALGRATLATIPHAGHISNLEQPDAFSRGLGDFLLARL